MASLSDLLAKVTQAQYFATMMAGHKGNSVPVASWTSPRNTGLSLTQVFSQGLAALRGVVSDSLAGLLLDYAFGVPLTLFAKSQFQLDRILATPTVGQMVLSSVAGAPAWTFAPGDVVVGTPGPTSGTRLFRSITGGTLLPGGTLTLTFQAEETGAAWNIPTGSPLDLKTSAAGVSATNPAIGLTGTWITSAGSDLESDASLKIRCRSRWGTLGTGGNEDAFRFWAMVTPDGYSASPVRQVEIFASQLNGQMNGGAATVAIAGQSGALAAADVAAVQRNFDQPITSLDSTIPGLNQIGKKYPIGCIVQVVTVSNLTVALTGVVYVYRRANVALADVQGAVTAAITDYQNQVRIGQRLYPQQRIAGVIEAAPGYAAAIARVDLSGMPTQISPTMTQYPKLDTTALTYQLTDQ